MTQEQIEKLLFLHCGKDDYRPRLKSPFKLKDWFFGTSGLTMVQVPVSLFPFTFPEDEKAPDCLRILPIDRHEPIVISVPKLIKLIDSAPKVPLSIDCDTCGGEGEQECDLGHMHECEDCNGDGYIEHTDKKEPDPNQTFVIHGIAFRVAVLQIIIQSASLIECENISMTWYKPEKPCLFELRDGIQMLIAPCFSTNMEPGWPEYITVTESLEPAQ